MSEELSNAAAPVNVPLLRRLWQLTLGRIAALFLLMAASLFWHEAAFPRTLDAVLRVPVLIFVVWLAFALVFVAAVNWKKRLFEQIAVQFAADVLLIAWLVWATGDVRSPYITLFTVVICLTGVFFTAQKTLWAAIACAAFFTVLMLGVVFGALPRLAEAGAEVSNLRALQIIGFHDVAFLVVGLLAAQLAVRQKRSNVELQATVQNLTSLQRLHGLIVQSIRSGLVTTDLDGKIYIFNAAAEEITGYNSEDVQGWTIYDLLGNVRIPIAETLNALEKGDQPPRYEIDFNTPDNFQMRLGYSVSSLFGEDGELTGYIFTFQDLTDIRLMEESVRRKDRLAAVGRVAAGLAHEIRNPLGAMRGAIQVLQAGMDKQSAQAQLMDIVLRESDRLNSIISNFLAYARPRSGDVERVELLQVIKDSVTLLRHSPDVRSVHEVVEELPAHEVYVNADAAALKQVFWNLARNAVQAMPNGGKLIVKLRQTANFRVQIVFTDTGVGMPQSRVERLFEPFSDSTTGGTGLGLSIVYQIVRDHHGSINIRSSEGKGTTITVDLPALRSLETRAESLESEAA